ncbi:ATPase [Treponema sp. R8-4-B8]
MEIKKFQEIETFHLKLRVILENEFSEEYKKNKILLDQIEKNIDEYQSIIETEGLPVETTRKELDEYYNIKKQIEDLDQQNKIYNNQQELKESVKVIKKQLEERQAGYLRDLQNTITRQMEKFNNYIYNGQKKAPVLTLENGNKYIFETPDDTGTGISYKGLVVFDLSILALTCLPVLVHDSVVLKQIADAPLEKILELYQQSGKQIFIALDKVSSYPQQAQNILEQNAVIHLSDNGNELFGRSWNAK